MPAGFGLNFLLAVRVWLGEISGTLTIASAIAPKLFRLLLLSMLMSGCGPAKSTSVRPVAEPGKPANISATKDQPFENSLGMRFVPVVGTSVLFSIWETRGQDYAAYLEGTGARARSQAVLKPSHPASNLSWEDSSAFCSWLTVQERESGRIGAQDHYRLPSDKEWGAAIGPDKYPWGNQWPPPKLVGGLAPAFIPEGGENTAPVGSFAPNRFGIYDLAGNVFEWVEDWYRKEMNPDEIRLEHKLWLNEDGDGKKYKVLRGASWIMLEPMNLLSAYRYINTPAARGGLYGFRCVLEVNGGR